MNNNPLAILISGYTAAGKTTHSHLLAEHFGCGYLGASEFRRQLLCSRRESGIAEWDPGIDLLRRRSLEADRRLDALMSERMRASPVPLVVDAWLQPWLCRDRCAVRVWIASSAESRIAKAKVTFMRAGLPVPGDIDRQVGRKDRFSRRIFGELYGIDFAPDPSVFDVIVDNTRYIAESSIEASDNGIAEFEPVLEQAIEEACSQKKKELRTASYARPRQGTPICDGMTDRCG